MASEVEDLLKRLVGIDSRAGVFGACECAQTVLYLMPEGEDRPKEAIDTAMAWVTGHASEQDCRNAARAAYEAADAYAAEAYATDAYAAYAAAYAAEAAEAAETVEAAAYAEAAACAVSPDVDSRAWQQARKQHLQTLHTLVSFLPWPRTTPTAAQLHAAAPHVQVAWDAVCALSGELTMAQLLAAHDHATALDLDWGDPMQRAVAERVQNVERVCELLQGSTNTGGG